MHNLIFILIKIKWKINALNITNHNTMLATLKCFHH